MKKLKTKKTTEEKKKLKTEEKVEIVSQKNVEKIELIIPAKEIKLKTRTKTKIKNEEIAVNSINNDAISIQNILSQYSFGNPTLENEISRRMMLLQKTRNLQISKLSEKKEILEDVEIKIENQKEVSIKVNKEEVVNKTPKEVVVEVKEVVIEQKEVGQPIVMIEIDTKDAIKTDKLDIEPSDELAPKDVPIPILLPGVLPKKNGFQMPADLETLARTLGYDAAVDLFRITCGLKGE